MPRLNDFGQPIGAELVAWAPPAFPSADGLTGDRACLVPLRAEAHGADLVQAFAAGDDSLWTYMSYGPFADEADLARTIDALKSYPDWQPYAIVVGGAAIGFASYLRIDQAAGVIEIGAIAFSPSLQRTAAATEALFLMIDGAFALGYRRCEWKCDDLNAPSRTAALRLGFEYEGTFRQATHYKGRNRDTAWYAIVDADWPALRSAFVSWLARENFDEAGQQRAGLQALRSLDRKDGVR